jgi:hypothetical protein
MIKGKKIKGQGRQDKDKRQGQKTRTKDKDKRQGQKKTNII